MPVNRYLVPFLLLTGAALAPLAALPQAGEDVLAAAAEWPLVGGSTTNAWYSPLTRINTQNVSKLGAAWTSEPFADGAISRGTPVVKDGRMFVTAGPRVYAFDARSGRTLWSYSTTSGQGPTGIVQVLNEGRALPSSHGVGTGEGLVFVGQTDARVIALKQDSGELVWSTQTGRTPPKRGQTSSGAPTYANGLVFTGLGNGDWALSGKVVALDAKTGRSVWEFNTIPGPGEFGFETWQNDNDAWKRGGGGVWLVGAVDPMLGLVYFVVGNAVPQYAGELRGGDNLFVGAVVALDMKTGRRRWHFQTVHHDLWDMDLATPPALYEAQVNGRTRPAIAVLRPDGYLFLLDRENGKPIVPVEERPVPQNAAQKTARTQPFPVGGESLLPPCSFWKDKMPAGFVLGCDFTPPSAPPPSKDPQNVLAAALVATSGVRAVPMSFSPQTGYFYALGNAGLAWWRRGDDPYLMGPGGRVPGLKSYQILAAFDSRTGKLAWKKQVETPNVIPNSGTMATGGGLLFHQAADGPFQALDARTGTLLFQFQTAGSGRPGIAASYELDGEQYVAASSGTAMWAYKIGGTLPPRPARPSTSAAADPAGFTGPIATSSDIETTSLVRGGVLTGGQRYFIDEFAFNPYRTRVKAGTYVTWINNGRIPHTIAGLDGSWTTERLSPAADAVIKFDKPGRYTYICKEHPWAYGQLIVE